MILIDCQFIGTWVGLLLFTPVARQPSLTIWFTPVARQLYVTVVFTCVAKWPAMTTLFSWCPLIGKTAGFYCLYLLLGNPTGPDVKTTQSGDGTEAEEIRGCAGTEPARGTAEG